MAVIAETAVLVRYLTGAPSTLAAQATALIEGSEPVLAPVVAIHETAFVLTRHYGVPRDAVVDLLVDLLERENVDTREVDRRALALVARGQADQDALEEWLTPEQRAERGALSAWAAKDHVAHNNFWRQEALGRLEAARDGSPPPADVEDENAQNDSTF